MAARGFTLIELLISITIIGVVLVVVMGALRIGINAWEKGEADIEAYQRQQIVLQLVKQQLASIQPAEISKEEQSPYYFLGGRRTVEFVSGVSIIPGNRYGRVFVKYRIREGGADNTMSLQIYETGLATAAGAESPFDPGEEAYHFLLEDMAGIRFDFLLQKGDSPPEWRQEWDPETVEAELPRAVRISIQADKEAPEVSAVGRIAVDMEEST
ncbi:MAG TPA: prepilin-type N-terminal cleavage/methylation domain-containing protein [Desulfosalsimonadaceae bacterium]|nr:prepilin-type N-terminal cleavage/methylation domain-containing protein [Desulfosalsimonadaceae bacterium]